MAESRGKSMTQGKALDLILRFSIPLLLGNLFQQAYNLTDAAIVGRTLGANALASVGVSSSVQFLVLGFCIGMPIGFTIPVASSFGAKDYRTMRRYVWIGGMLTALFAALLTALTVSLCGWILHTLQTPAEIYADAYAYLSRSSGASPAPFSIIICPASYAPSATRRRRSCFWPFPRLSTSSWISSAS